MLGWLLGAFAAWPSANSINIPLALADASSGGSVGAVAG
jgi:hypothetical protein